MKWVVVSPKYVQSGSEKNWKEFLASLGVEEGIAIEKINQKLTTTEVCDATYLLQEDFEFLMQLLYRKHVQIIDLFYCVDYVKMEYFKFEEVT